MNKFEDLRNDLKNGNKRFMEKQPLERKVEPKSLKDGQQPEVIVLTCADSRVPPELIFDKDLGELFVIRIAGNTATDEAIGSIEYAAANLGSSVCLVLGHTSCGAVAAAVESEKNNSPLPSACLEKVVEPIRPAVKKAKEKEVKEDQVLSGAITQNVFLAAATLMEKSPILKKLSEEGSFKVEQAVYNLDSGRVDFLK